MIYVIGVDSDKTFLHFVKFCTSSDVEVTPINIRSAIQTADWRFSIPDDGQSYLCLGSAQVLLDSSDSYYVRAIDLASVQSDDESAWQWTRFLAALNVWLDQIPGIVVNRPGAWRDNALKPLHEYNLRQMGFQVPDAVTSTDAEILRQFIRGGATIRKAVTGSRTNSRLVSLDFLLTYTADRGPVHLQRFVRGYDVRVHVVGDEVVAEKICSDVEDYRLPAANSSFSEVILPAWLRSKVVEATRHFGLSFAGWDFKVSEDGSFWALEANPMPGYDGYDRRLDNRISRLLTNYLAKKM